MKRLIPPRCSALTESCRAALTLGATSPLHPSTHLFPPRLCFSAAAGRFHNCFSRHIPSTLQHATVISANSRRLCHLALDLNAQGGRWWWCRGWGGGGGGGGGDVGGGVFFCFISVNAPQPFGGLLSPLVAATDDLTR